MGSRPPCQFETRRAGGLSLVPCLRYNVRSFITCPVLTFEEVAWPRSSPRKHEWQELQPDHGVFVVEPFEPGFALTVGNAFRRVLLSSIEGAAPTWIKIEGVLHEFSFLPGATEDSLDILDEPPQGRLQAPRGAQPAPPPPSRQGPGVAKASDFQTDHDLVILNPEPPLATLERDVTLEMEVHVEKGRGYVPADKREAETLAVNAHPMDADFSPVKR